MNDRLRLDPDPLRPDDEPEYQPVVSRGVQRWVIIALVILGLIVAAILSRPVASVTPTVWVAVPPSDFTTFPASSSGQPMSGAGVGVADRTSDQGVRTEPTAPSGTPVPSPSPSARTRHTAPTLKPRASAIPRPGHYLTAGVATMTDTSCAAAGPALRNALGTNWRGTAVRVWYGKQHADTTLCDWCACRGRPGGPTVADLPPWMFRRFGVAPGVIPVRIERL